MLGLSVIILFKSLLHVFCSLVFSAHNSSVIQPFYCESNDGKNRDVCQCFCDHSLDITEHLKIMEHLKMSFSWIFLETTVIFIPLQKSMDTEPTTSTTLETQVYTWLKIRQKL